MNWDRLLLIIGALGGSYIIYQRHKEELEQKKRADEIFNKPLPFKEIPTIVTAEAAAIAERQYIAMNQPGTDEEELFRSLNNLNGADLRLVYKAFGKRKYSWLTGPLDLFGWYVNELDAGELKRMKIYWWKAGITF